MSASTPSVDSESTVTLREITRETLQSILDLAVTPDQGCFVAPNDRSLAEAHFAPEAWYRAIYANETPVGFVMLADHPEKPLYYVWRFMIDTRHQRKGFGRRAMDLVVEHVRTRPGATELLLSFVPGQGDPEPFYLGLGFERTGKMHEDEHEMSLPLVT